MYPYEVLAAAAILCGARMVWVDRREFVSAFCSYRWKVAQGRIRELNDNSIVIDAVCEFHPASYAKFTETQYV